MIVDRLAGEIGAMAAKTGGSPAALGIAAPGHACPQMRVTLEDWNAFQAFCEENHYPARNGFGELVKLLLSKRQQAEPPKPAD